MVGKWSRRALLASAGGVFLAGCQTWSEATSPASTADEPSGPHDFGERVDVGDGTIHVAGSTLRESILGPTSPFPVIRDPEDEQFLLLDIEVDGIQRHVFEFELRTKGADGNVLERYTPGRVNERRWPGTVGFRVTVETVEQAVFIAERENGERTIRWRLPGQVVERVDAVPEFELVDASIVDEETVAAVEMTVRNTGERDGILVATIADGNVKDSAQPVTIPVAAGERGTERKRISERRHGQWEITNAHVRRVVYE